MCEENTKKTFRGGINLGIFFLNHKQLKIISDDEIPKRLCVHNGQNCLGTDPAPNLGMTTYEHKTRRNKIDFPRITVAEYYGLNLGAVIITTYTVTFRK